MISCSTLAVTCRQSYRKHKRIVRLRLQNENALIVPGVILFFTVKSNACNNRDLSKLPRCMPGDSLIVYVYMHIRTVKNVDLHCKSYGKQKLAQQAIVKWKLVFPTGGFERSRLLNVPADNDGMNPAAVRLQEMNCMHKKRADAIHLQPI